MMITVMKMIIKHMDMGWYGYGYEYEYDQQFSTPPQNHGDVGEENTCLGPGGVQD